MLMKLQIPSFLQKSKSNEDKVIETMIAVMKEMSISYEELKSMPLPVYFKIVSTLDEWHKKEEKAMKKASRKR